MYKRQDQYGRLLRYVYLDDGTFVNAAIIRQGMGRLVTFPPDVAQTEYLKGCLLYTSDAADERSSVDLGGRRIIKKKNKYEE